MKPTLSGLIAFVTLVTAPLVRAQGELIFFPEDFGGRADDGEDDRQAIQAALNAADLAGNGIVQLGPGVYDVRVVVSSGLGALTGFGGNSSGYQGVTVPPGCTLTGAGRDATTLRILAGDGSPNTIGDGVVNGGYQTALTDFGAGGGIRLSDFRIFTPDTTVSPSGNLIGVAHADGVTISNIAFGTSRHHALEINLSRNVVVEDCDFDGDHGGASTIQFDMGSFGAKSLRPTGTVIRDVVVRRCQFHGRRGDSAYSGKVIELGHTSSACILRNIAFEDCTLESLVHPGSVCVSNDNPAAQELSGLRFERCHFVGLQEETSINGLLQFTLQGTQLLQDLTVRRCTFSGAFTHGLVVITPSWDFNSGHSQRRRILLEGNVFTPSFQRSSPYYSSALRMLSVAACSDVTIRRNLFQFPDTAVNLAVSGVYAIQASNSLDTRIEDNVFTWAHNDQSTAPFSASRLHGIFAPVYQLEQNGTRARMQVTGNVFLHPVNGIGAALYMATNVSTVTWAAGGPWVGGLVAGNYSSGAGSNPVWYIHHDLSTAGNIGQVLPADPSRTIAAGWYPCNGAALTSLDSGPNALPRVNAGNCGYVGNLPAEPGTAVRLRGPLTGEGLLAPLLARYAGSTYRGTDDAVSELISLPVADLLHGSLRVVRDPLTVYRWEESLPAETAPAGSLAPVDKPAEAPGFWVPFNTFVDSLADDADLDGDGRSNLFERAFLSDPSTPDGEQMFSLDSGPGDGCTINFRCASGPHSPRICLLQSSDLSHWEVESSCSSGGPFEPPATGSLQEAKYLTGREIKLTTPQSSRRFWRVAVEP